MSRATPAAAMVTSPRRRSGSRPRASTRRPPSTLYLYVFNNRAAFERNRDKVGPCAAGFVTDPASFEEIEQSPYVVASQGPWAPRFEAVLRATLEQAAGTGG